jgi:hypothetical protein
MQVLDEYFYHVLTPDRVRSGHISAVIVYQRIKKETVDRARKTVTLSLQRMAEYTGLSKSAVQKAIRILIEREDIGRVERTTATSTSEYRILKPCRSR